MVYYGLKSDWRINKIYKYYPKFEKVILVMESGFPFFSFHYPNEIKF